MRKSELERRRQRLYNRVPLIGRWLRQRTLSSIRAEESIEGIRLLADICAESGQSAPGRDALRTLWELAHRPNQAARDALLRLALYHDRQDLLPELVRNHIEPRADGVVEVWTSVRAIEGRANDAVCRMVAEWLGLPASRVRIVSGARGRTKRIEVDGLFEWPT